MIVIDTELLIEVLDMMYNGKPYNIETATCAKCVFGDLCSDCAKRKYQFWNNYHVLRNMDEWRHCISRKFKNTKIVWLLDCIIEYSSYDIEILLRTCYEKIYIAKSNQAHENWKNNLKNKSITWGKKRVSENYWTNLIYKILEMKTKEVGKKERKNVIDRMGIITDKFLKNKKKIVKLKELDLNYDTDVDNRRIENFGDDFKHKTLNFMSLEMTKRLVI